MTRDSSAPSEPVRSQPPAGLWKSEDWWAVWVGGTILLLALLAVYRARPGGFPELPSGVEKLPSPLSPYVASLGKWNHDPAQAFVDKAGRTIWPGMVGVFLISGTLFTLGAAAMGQPAGKFLPGFVVIFGLAVLAFLLAGQKFVDAWGLEYVLWALVLGLLISNTVGTARFLRPALRTEFYIKTGLVLLGAEVLLHRLLALGVPGIFVSWVTTPIVLIGTYLFGQYVLGIRSRSLNLVISADMSVCGVSAAIATAAACRAKKEELSLAIALSLGFTAVMMVVLPLVIKLLGISEVLGGAWIGGTIDSTGAVAAAGVMLGETAKEVAVTVKMIQNILIGVISFAVAVYWVSWVERNPKAPHPGVMEIWYRFPKFVIGFILASLVFSALYAWLPGGSLLGDAVVGDSKTLRNWFFCLAFVSIGLETNIGQLLRDMQGGKPLVLYVCGQSLNLALTLLMAWLMFEVVFPQAANP